MFSRSFYFLLIGQALSNLGDVFYVVALLTVVFDVTKSATGTAVVPFIFSGAELIGGLLAPSVMDRWPLKTVLVSFQGTRTIIMILLAVLFPVVNHSLYSIFLFVAAVSFLDGWTRPTERALLPSVVENQYLVKANGLVSSTNQTMFLISWAAGGVLVAALGSSSVLWITVVLFVGTTLLMMFINGFTPPQGDHRIEASWLKRMREGWEVLWHHPILRTTLAMDVAETIANSVWTGAIMIVFAEEVLHQGKAWWGFMNASFYIGTIGGGLMAVLFSKKMNASLGKTMVAGCIFMAVFTAAFALIPIPWVSLILCAACGPAFQFRDIAQNTIFQIYVPREKVGKIYAARGSLINSLFGISVLFMGVVADRFGPSAAYLTAACLFGISAILGFLYKPLRSSGSE